MGGGEANAPKQEKMLQKIFRILGFADASHRFDHQIVNLHNASIPPGQRVYVIGDIHGRNDLLEELLALIIADAARHPTGIKQLVFLGDYVDRGPDSRGTINTILHTRPKGFSPVFLMGNHEEAMLEFLRDPVGGASWLQFGGSETLLSYGVSVPPGIPKPTTLRRIAKAFSEALPEDHYEFLKHLQDNYFLGDYMFVHAGIDPERSLSHQRPSDLRWIRDSFIHHDGHYDKVIVHGHTITQNVEFRANRIGLDTGAYFSGRLTCLVLEDRNREMLQTGPRQG